MDNKITRTISVPERSTLTAEEYAHFLRNAYSLIRRYPHLLAAEDEDINSLELAHLYPPCRESVIAIYLGINDAVCNKGLVSPFLIRHGHNNVFAFEPTAYAGGADVPSGTIDAADVLSGFEPPNTTWNPEWTYVMIADPDRSVESLWQQDAYIDLIPAKLEDFTMLGDTDRSKVCFFVDPEAFAHPVNANRSYLDKARDRGQRLASEFAIPETVPGETDGLDPVVLARGEKLYVARTDFAPCAHAWSNLHPDNEEYAVINENSAVPLDLLLRKPPVHPTHAGKLKPPRGSADMTTDWFRQGRGVHRQPILQGTVKG